MSIDQNGMANVKALIAAGMMVALATAASAGTEADSLYEAALRQVGQVDTEASVAAFEKVLAADRDHVPAMVELAKRYTSTETVEGRAKAERLITRAMKLSPEAPEHRLVLGDLMWAMQRADEAEDHYMKVLERDSTNAQAAYRIGLLAAKEFYKYKDMRHSERLHDGVRGIRPTIATWEWDEEAEAARSDAVHWLARAIDFDPDFKDAICQLGRIYLEVGQPRGLLGLSKVLLERKPDDLNGLLFFALAQQKLGDEKTAAEYYERALAEMGEEDRATMESFDILLPREEDPFHPAPRLETESFWREQDPLYLTDYNERRMEHYGRVAYADLAFGVPSKGVHGWQTDMGKTIVKFGQPRGRYVRRPQIPEVGPPIDSDIPGGGLPQRSSDPAAASTWVPLQEHSETWAYEGFSIEFLNWGDGFDGWRLEAKYRGMFDTTDSARMTFFSKPARFVDPYRDEKYATSRAVTGFREEDDARFEIAYALPRSRVTAKGDEGFLSLEDGLFVFDDEWNEVYRDVEEHFELEPVADDSLRSQFLLATREIELEPGTYHLVSEVMDRESGSIGTFKEGLIVGDRDTLLAMSDLLLAVDIRPLTEFPGGREDLEIRPNPLRIYPRTDPVRIYFEIYNLQEDDYGRTKYDVSYRVGWPEKEEVDASLFPEITTEDREGYVVVDVVRRQRRNTDPPFISTEGVATPPEPSAGDIVDYQVTWVEPKGSRKLPEQPDRQVGETTVTVEYEGDREDDFTFLMIDVSRMPAGVRKLTVTVKDRVRGGTAVKEAYFRLVE